MTPNKEAVAAVKALNAEKQKAQAALRRRSMTNEGPETRALSIVGMMMADFKVGEPDGLTEQDLKTSCKELSDYLPIRDANGNTVDVLQKMMQAFQFYGKKTRDDRAKNNEERLEKAKEYQRTVQNARDAEKMKDIKFKDLKSVTVGELYIEAFSNGGMLYASAFTPDVWAAVVKYRDLVHKVLILMHEYDPDSFDDDDGDYRPSNGETLTELHFLNSFAEDALRQFKPTERFASECEFAEVNEKEADKLYELGVSCIAKVISDKGAQIFATSKGVCINDGVHFSAIVEEYLNVGLAVMTVYDKDRNFNQALPYGSLKLYPYAIDYAELSRSSYQLFLEDQNGQS